jgi:hypothetical protein
MMHPIRTPTVIVLHPTSEASVVDAGLDGISCSLDDALTRRKARNNRVAVCVMLDWNNFVKLTPELNRGNLTGA